jgi:hypothetical protein
MVLWGGALHFRGKLVEKAYLTVVSVPAAAAKMVVSSCMTVQAADWKLADLGPDGLGLEPVAAPRLIRSNQGSVFLEAQSSLAPKSIPSTMTLWAQPRARLLKRHKLDLGVASIRTGLPHLEPLEHPQLSSLENPSINLSLGLPVLLFLKRPRAGYPALVAIIIGQEPRFNLKNAAS